MEIYYAARWQQMENDGVLRDADNTTREDFVSQNRILFSFSVK